MIKLLVTRVLPEPIWEDYSLDNFEVIEHDFVDIIKAKPLEYPAHRNVLVSSQNAVGTFDLKQKRVFCVGTRTQSALEEGGFSVHQRFSSASDMANEVTKLGQPATFICGSKRLPIVEEVFRDKQLKLQVLVVYKTTRTPRKFFEKWDAILFFSPSGVHSFHEQNKQAPLAICIGETTAECAQTYGHPTVLSKNQTKKSVVQAAVDHFQS
jgi:uroporphyrinogen-III synthase